MTEVNATIFRKYDIRGTAVGDDAQLTPTLALLVGKGLGTYLPTAFGTERVFVGRDNRLTSPALHAAMIEGLLSTGMAVTDIGESITPTVYYAAASYGSKGAGVQITGSHLTTKYNGIKMSYGSLALFDQQIQDVLKLIQTDAFTVGQGVLSQDFDLVNRHMARIQGMVTLAKPMKVVLDAGNGLIGGIFPQVLRNLGCEVVELYTESDGTYPNHLPNPEDPEMTKDLEAKVIETGADIGLAFDGDSDRCGFIDEHGHHIAADRLLAILARDVLTRIPGATIVYDVKCSQALPDIIRQHGGVPVMWKTGHSLMKQKIAELGSPLGGEVSGHLFTGENYYGFDDAPLVALRALQVFSQTDKTVSEIFAELPQLEATPEIILPAPDHLKFQIIEDITKALDETYEVFTLDGARAQFENGWGVVRASNTQPAVTLRFEAYTAPDLVKYMNLFKAQLDKYPEVDTTILQGHIRNFSAKG
ncbi:MAG: phosphomannomutase/phosphoglucomutase [Pleurocapsa minor GSE-CHR-MK-17-07R]|jgi:phosphomannomutase|nr:phosphomannomutase/phosphoglucomutase [Pleurocapsa minor GSE-CHR-MK 17-07R]